MKILIGLILLLATFSVNGSVYIEKTTANNGAPLIRIANPTQYTLYCYVSSQYGYFDFYIQPKSYSRWYYEPNGYYQWQCK